LGFRFQDLGFRPKPLASDEPLSWALGVSSGTLTPRTISDAIANDSPRRELLRVDLLPDAVVEFQFSDSHFGFGFLFFVQHASDAFAGTVSSRVPSAPSGARRSRHTLMPLLEATRYRSRLLEFGRLCLGPTQFQKPFRASQIGSAARARLFCSVRPDLWAQVFNLCSELALGVSVSRFKTTAVLQSIIRSFVWISGGLPFLRLQFPSVSRLNGRWQRSRGLSWRQEGVSLALELARL
jgi:hypothetical protein